MTGSHEKPVPGEWYWGGTCPLCGQFVPVFHDPSRGKPEMKLEGQTQGVPHVSIRCPRNHGFDVAAADLQRAEYRSSES